MADQLQPTDQQFVQKLYPSARIEKKGFSYFVKARGNWPNGQCDKLLGIGRMKEAAAWAAAARNLKEEQDVRMLQSLKTSRP